MVGGLDVWHVVVYEGLSHDDIPYDEDEHA